MCFVEARLCFIVLVHLSCVPYVPCATMTWRGGGGGQWHGMPCNGSCRRGFCTCVTCVTCAGRATMTRRGGGGGGGGGGVHRKVCRDTCRDMGKLQFRSGFEFGLCGIPRDLHCALGAFGNLGGFYFAKVGRVCHFTNITTTNRHQDNTSTRMYYVGKKRNSTKGSGGLENGPHEVRRT